MYASSVRILTKYSMNAFPKHRMAIHYLYIPLHVRWMLLRLRLRCKLLFELPGRRLWRRGVRVVRVRLMVKRMARLRVERAEKLPKSPKEFPQSNHPTSVRFWNPRAGPARISRSKVAANVQKQRMWHCQLSPRQRQGPKKTKRMMISQLSQLAIPRSAWNLEMAVGCMRYLRVKLLGAPTAGASTTDAKSANAQDLGEIVQHSFASTSSSNVRRMTLRPIVVRLRNPRLRNPNAKQRMMEKRVGSPENPRKTRWTWWEASISEVGVSRKLDWAYSNFFKCMCVYVHVIYSV